MRHRAVVTRKPPEAEVGACYRHGGKAFMASLGPLLGMGFFVAVLKTGEQLLWSGTDWLGSAAWVAGLAFGALLATPLNWGFFYVTLLAVRDEEVEVGDLFACFERYEHVVLANLICGFVGVAGLVFAIVPGVIAYCRLKFVPYLVIDAGLDATEAIRESLRLPDGLTGRIFGITVRGWGLSLLGLIAFGVGLIPASIWWDTAISSLYDASVETLEELEAEPAAAH